MSETTFRVFTGIIFIGSLFISGYFRSKADRDSGEKLSRKNDGPGMMWVTRIGALILWLSPILYLINPNLIEWSRIGIPNLFRWLGVLLGLTCAALLFWMFKSIGNGISPTSATRQNHVLITRGPYRWVRHPLYTIGSGLFISLGLIADTWFFALLGTLAFLAMAIRTPREEASLVEKFGDDYINYMKRTGRYFPKWF